MKNLFIDDEDIQSIDNLARALHQPEKFKENNVIRPEYRWENCGLQIRTAPAWVPEEKLFKILYLASSEALDGNLKLSVTGDPMGAGCTCYAVSEDGVNWEKPMLGLYDYDFVSWDGKKIGKKNNIVPYANSLLLAPIYDGKDPSPDRRYKGMTYVWGKGRRLVVSPDCIHWTELDEINLPSQDEANLTYEEDEQLFIATVKCSGPYGRSWKMSTSRDFINWTELKMVFHADQTDQEIGRERIEKFFNDKDYLAPMMNRPEEFRTDVYQLPVFKYEGIYLALPTMFHQSGKHTPMYENVDGRKTIELASSRDLYNWSRVANRAPFITQSPVGDGSAYDTGQLAPANKPVIRNNEIWFYYTGLRHRAMSYSDVINKKYLDSGAICMARLRMDGFVSLKGGAEWGHVTTMPFKLAGEHLHVNVDSWRGRVLTEILAPDEDRPIEGYSAEDCEKLMINSIDAEVTWKNKRDVSELNGKTVRIRFSLLRSEIYAFWFQ